MLRTIEDILAKGDKLVLLGFFTVEPKFYKEKKHVLEWKEQAKMCMRFQKDIRQSLNLVDVVSFWSVVVGNSQFNGTSV